MPSPKEVTREPFARFFDQDEQGRILRLSISGEIRLAIMEEKRCMEFILSERDVDLLCEALQLSKHIQERWASSR